MEKVEIYFTSVIFYAIPAVLSLLLWKFRGCNLTKICYDYALKSPIIKQKITRELNKAEEDIRKKLHGSYNNLNFLDKLPDVGLQNLVLKEANAYKNIDDENSLKGKVSGCLYHVPDSNLLNVQTEIFKLFAYTNPLHPDIYPSVMKMEAEIIRFCCDLFGGSPKLSCGTVTTGGTESILLACLAYRNYGYKRGILNPEIIIGESAHAAFLKACSYFKIQCVTVGLNKNTYQVNLVEIEDRITNNTIAIVVSAPSYPHGIIDPIDQVAQIGLKHEIPVHVDACLGGFLIPFVPPNGLICSICTSAATNQQCPAIKFDSSKKLFTIPGVTSISADTHKYGFTPKGSSVILYNDPEYLHAQYFVATDWMGGIYPSQTLSGSRSGLNIALSWATLMYYGKDGYTSSTINIIKTTREIVTMLNGLSDQVNFQILGHPQLNVIAIGNKSDGSKLVYDVYDLAHEMTNKSGWNLNYIQNPKGFHLCVTQVHTTLPNFAQTFVNDLVKYDGELKFESERKVNKNHQSTNVGALYCFAQSISDQTPIIDLVIKGYLDGYYSKPSDDSHNDKQNFDT